MKLELEGSFLLLIYWQRITIRSTLPGPSTDVGLIESSLNLSKSLSPCVVGRWNSTQAEVLRVLAQVLDGPPFFFIS